MKKKNIKYKTQTELDEINRNCQSKGGVAFVWVVVALFVLCMSICYIFK